MDNVEFAKKMLKLGELLTEADVLIAELGDHVIALGRSQSIGDVEAKYSGGRATYDWERTVREHPSAEAEPEAWGELVAQHTELIPQTVKIDWRGIANRMDWEGIVVKEPIPSVKFSLLKETER